VTSSLHREPGGVIDCVTVGSLYPVIPRSGGCGTVVNSSLLPSLEKKENQDDPHSWRTNPSCVHGTGQQNRPV